MRWATDEMKAWSREEFERELRRKEARYHTHHPFHIMMNEGRLNREAIPRPGSLTAFYYQSSIPMKDGAIISNCPDREIRRAWIVPYSRPGRPGGRGRRTRVLDSARRSCWHHSPPVDVIRAAAGPRCVFAVDAYVNFAKARPWQEAVCSSLTEMFAPQSASGSSFQTGLGIIRGLTLRDSRTFGCGCHRPARDVEDGLRITLDYFNYPPRSRRRALDILQFKLDVLWAILDAVQLEYGTP